MPVRRRRHPRGSKASRRTPPPYAAVPTSAPKQNQEESRSPPARARSRPRRPRQSCPTDKPSSTDWGSVPPAAHHPSPPVPRERRQRTILRVNRSTEGFAHPHRLHLRVHRSVVSASLRKPRGKRVCPRAADNDQTPWLRD